MYLRAGILSLGLLLASRVLGLLRESVQAASLGATGLGDAVIVMFTLPDLLVSMVFSGALGYVLLPLWARQQPAQLLPGQRKLARRLCITGLLLGAAIWLMRDAVVRALAPGLQGELRSLGAASLLWSAAALPLAMLAALWATRLQHERDFVGMQVGNLALNVCLIAGLLLVAGMGWFASVLPVLGAALLLGALARLAWLYWRLPKAAVIQATAQAGHDAAALPRASVWLWAALSSGLLLVLPIMARSLASQSGEGALANFNYAWKLVELPLVLAIQLVATVAFPAITRTQLGSAERRDALQMAFLLAWALACAAIVVVAIFSRPLAQLLFGWGRMSAANLDTIAQWSSAGVWSLLPQALIAVVLTAVAIAEQMRVAVWAYAGGIAALGLAGWLGLGRADGGTAGGLAVMWALNAVLAGVALVLILSQRRFISGSLPLTGLLVPLGVCLMLVAAGARLPQLGLAASTASAVLMAALVLASAALASPLLRAACLQVMRRMHPARSAPPL